MGPVLYEDNEELHTFHASSNIIRIIRPRIFIWVGHVASMGQITNAHNMLVGKSERKRPLGRPKRRWKDNNIIMGEIGWIGVAWKHLALDMEQWRAVAKTVMNLRVEF
jgi:hypothetical protein